MLEPCILITYLSKKKAFLKGYIDGRLDAESENGNKKYSLSFYPFNSLQTKDKLVFLVSERHYTAVASDQRRVNVYVNDQIFKGDITAFVTFQNHESEITHMIFRN